MVSEGKSVCQTPVNRLLSWSRVAETLVTQKWDFLKFF